MKTVISTKMPWMPTIQIITVMMRKMKSARTMTPSTAVMPPNLKSRTRRKRALVWKK